MAHTRKEEPIKYCAYCGEQMHRVRYPSRLEDLGAFKRRKYCSRECMAKAFDEKEHTGTSHYAEHRYARELKKADKCELCGSTTNVDVHHKDGNYHNNALDNLIALCRSCHMKEHRPKSVCIICGKPARGHGYCDKHLQRFRKYGDPLLTNRGHGHIVKAVD